MKSYKKLKIYTLLVIGVLFISNFQAVKANEKEFGNKPVLQIPFEEEFNTVVIPIKINGLKTFRCVLDTGMPSGVFLLNPEKAKELKLKYAMTNVNAQGAGAGSQTASLAMGANVRLDNIEFKNQRIIVLNKVGELAHIGIDGAIGASIFNNYIVQIDFEKKLLSLYPVKGFNVENAGEKLDLKIANTKAFVKISVEVNKGKNVPVSLLLDTGASTGLAIETKASPLIDLPRKSIKGILGAGVGGDIYGSIARIRAVNIGKYKLENVVTNFPETNQLINSDGTLGMEILKRFLVTIDYTNNQMFLKANTTLKHKFEFNMIGIAAKPNAKGNLKVNHVFKDSPADQSGIKKDDEIISINGKMLDFSKYRQLTESLRKEGKKITIAYKRNGKKHKAVLKLRRLI